MTVGFECMPLRHAGKCSLAHIGVEEISGIECTQHSPARFRNTEILDLVLQQFLHLPLLSDELGLDAVNVVRDAVPSA